MPEKTVLVPGLGREAGRKNRVREVGMTKDGWPRGPKSWIVDRVLYVSIPFTWNLPQVFKRLRNADIEFDSAVVGGPAVVLMPDYFKELAYVKTGGGCIGAMQLVNNRATKTTTGCPNKCGFCAVPKIEGYFRELEDWPDRPIICDNNLLAASIGHFDKIIDRLKKHDRPDFNQGLDARLLNIHHSKRLTELKRPIIRLALDNIKWTEDWLSAFGLLRCAGIALRSICSYALIGFDSDPGEAWARCQWIESYGVKAFPQWFHELDAMKANQVTERQRLLGWNDYERRRIMQWYYQHKKAVAA